LLRHEPDIQVVGEASSPSEIMSQVQSRKPDLLFLDICMPTMNGLDVIAELPKDKSVPMPHVIITTAHGEYAVRAFEMRAADYLLKPYTAERLHSALNYARERVQDGMAKGSPEAKPAGNRLTPARI